MIRVDVRAASRLGSSGGPVQSDGWGTIRLEKHQSAKQICAKPFTLTAAPIQEKLWQCA